LHRRALVSLTVPVRVAGVEGAVVVEDWLRNKSVCGEYMALKRLTAGTIYARNIELIDEIETSGFARPVGA